MTPDAKFIEYRWHKIGDNNPVALFMILNPVSKYCGKKVSLEFMVAHGMPVPEHPTFDEWKKQQASIP